MSKWRIEKKLWARGYRTIVGIDEVGYGCVAGPVVAGAVIWSPEVGVSGLNDSKKLTAVVRRGLSQKIMKKALAWGVGESSVMEINSIGLGRARKLAMTRAIDNMGTAIDYLLVDGINFSYGKLVGERIIGGDGKSASIMAASIIAKVYRDKMMTSLHRLYRRYGWLHNKGYGTKLHLARIKQYGLTAWHRINYKCFDGMDKN